MPEHHHHFYDEHDNAAVLTHNHDYITVEHATASIPAGMPIYWDHPGTNCVVCMGVNVAVKPMEGVSIDIRTEPEEPDA